MASVDQGDAEINQFIELAVERAADAGIEAEKILKHLRAVRQSLLHIAGLAAKSFFVDLLDFRACRFGADQGDARHQVLQDRE